MVGPTTPCAVPYEFRGLSRGEGGVSMCVSEEDGNPPWCQASSGRVDCVCPNAGDVWDGVKSGFARLRFTSVTEAEDCPPGTYYKARAWTREQASVPERPFRKFEVYEKGGRLMLAVCVPCPSGTFSRVVAAPPARPARPTPSRQPGAARARAWQASLAPATPTAGAHRAVPMPTPRPSAPLPPPQPQRQAWQPRFPAT